MIVCGLRIFFIILLSGEVFSQNVNVKVAKDKDKARNSDGGRNQMISHMDLLIDNMMHQRWEPDDSVCLEKILNVMNNVKNSTLWATWIWDAMQSPVGLLYGSKYHFGNYDQCMDAPWLHTHPEYRTQYCLAEIKLADEELEHTYIHPDSHVKNYIRTESKHGLTFNKVSLGVCLPVECKTRAVSQFVKVLFEDSHLGDAVPDVNITVKPCQIPGAPVEYSKEFYIVVTFLIFIMITTIICSLCNNGKKDTLGSKLVNAFCITANTQYLSKSTDDDIKVMHGMRFITSGIIVGLHVFFLTYWIGTGNALLFDRAIDKFNLTALYHVELVVDTFFMMSGLLLIKGLMASKKVNPFTLIAKRYLRLVWMISLFLTVSMYVIVYTGDGPLWPILSSNEVNTCNLNWWPNFLMLGNYIDTANMCYPILWTVPADFHLYTVGIITYWIFTKNRRVGTSIFGILFLASLIMPGYVTYQRKLSASPAFDLKAMAQFRDIILTNPTYVWTHLRAGPYFIGIIVGYIMSVYKPIHHRRVISKFCSSMAFIIAMTIAIMLMLMGGSFHDKSKPYNAWGSAIFASVNRTVWAVAMACVIVLCEYGTIPLVGTLLSWKPWIPFSKLSYGVYLLHSIVFSCIIASLRFPLTSSIYYSLIHSMGVTVVSNFLSYLLHLFFEAPMTKILNILINTKTEETNKEEKNNITKKKIA